MYYEEYVECIVTGNKVVGAGSSFHVSQALTQLVDATNNPVARIIS